MKHGEEGKYVYMTLHEWAQLEKRPRDWFVPSRIKRVKARPQVTWYPEDPKVWAFQTKFPQRWCIQGVHMELNGEATFYVRQVRLRPTQAELKYIQYLRDDTPGREFMSPPVSTY